MCMMHLEDGRPLNEKSHAYHFSITIDVNFAYWPLLQFLLSSKAYLMDGVGKFMFSFAQDPVLVIAIVRYYTKMSTKRCET